MGVLIDGHWQEGWLDTSATGGRFIRKDSAYRHRIGQDGCSFTAESGRYHLYVSLACPWAHRTLIMRALKGLEEVISLSVVHWRMLDNGWTFEHGPGVIPDTIGGARYMYEVYTAADPVFTGRVTVPVLWDKATGTIVNNESEDIVRILNSAFDNAGARPGDYYPAAHRAEIDRVNARIYTTLNNGVYQAGFATTQTAYEEALGPLFETLNWLEEHLGRTRYLIGGSITEADIRLFTTLARFDLIYHYHFKCNLRRLTDYTNLWDYTRDLYQTDGFGSTFNPDHAKRHYFESHATINPAGIVPAGPILDFTERTNRARLG